MKKSAFTLIELIFVILIVGILAAFAISKYQNLKANAQIANMFKVLTDVSNNAPQVYTNLVTLENKDPKTLYLSDFISLKSKNVANSSWKNKEGWFFQNTDDGSGPVSYYLYYKAYTVSSPAYLEYHYYNSTKNAQLFVRINCNRFDKDALKSKCIEKNGGKATSVKTISF